MICANYITSHPATVKIKTKILTKPLHGAVLFIEPVPKPYGFSTDS
jgi:hypothetical protein